jgi:hypothetical protein
VTGDEQSAGPDLALRLFISNKNVPSRPAPRAFTRSRGALLRASAMTTAPGFSGGWEIETDG